MRTVIIGGPRTGKTTRASVEIGSVLHTDDLAAGRDWSAQSQAASEHLGASSEGTMEGVTAVRALRKWMASHSGKPCERVIVMREAHQLLTEGQRKLKVGCETVWTEIEPELRRRGVAIE